MCARHTHKHKHKHTTNTYPTPGWIDVGASETLTGSHRFSPVLTGDGVLWVWPLQLPASLLCQASRLSCCQVNREQKLGARVVPSKVWNPDPGRPRTRTTTSCLRCTRRAASNLTFRILQLCSIFLYFLIFCCPMYVLLELKFKVQCQSEWTDWTTAEWTFSVQVCAKKPNEIRRSCASCPPMTPISSNRSNIFDFGFLKQR